MKTGNPSDQAIAEGRLDGRILSAFPGGFELARHSVAAATMGSTSHNTYVPKDDPDSIDDVDIMGVVVPPLRLTAGLHTWQHWTLQVEELDVVLYSLRKFVGLLLKGNPNVVGLLWLKPEHRFLVHPAFQPFVENRDIFSSRAAYHAFSGYAHDQIKKLENGVFKGYMGEKRKALVERHGYDAKMAAHALRLLRMGTEFLETGRLTVFREEDAEEIRSIKRGSRSRPRRSGASPAPRRRWRSPRCRTSRTSKPPRNSSWTPPSPSGARRATCADLCGHANPSQVSRRDRASPVRNPAG